MVPKMIKKERQCAQREFVMKTALFVVVMLLVLATGVAFGGTYDSTTTVLSSTFTSWDVSFGTLDLHGFYSTQQNLIQSTSTYSWLDLLLQGIVTEPFYDSSSTTRLEDVTTSQAGVMQSPDGGTSGTDDASTVTTNAGTVSDVDTTFYPTEDRMNVFLEGYKTLDTTSTSAIYGWNCWGLVSAGLSGGCAGSNGWTTSTTNSVLGGNWLDFDIIGGGIFVNFQSGQIDPWSNTYTQSGFDSWPSSPYIPDGPATTTPEPSTWALLVGGVLTLVGKRRYGRRRA
jgi:hypothetical protein